MSPLYSTIRRLAVVAVGAGVIACAEPPPRPPVLWTPSDIRAVPASFYEQLLAGQKTRGLTLKIFNTGRIRARGLVVSSIKSWDAKVRLDVPVFLIGHPAQGWILFDAGISAETARGLNEARRGFPFRYESSPGQDAASQLARAGVPAGSVRWLIFSHLHEDHAGLARSFPNATRVVSRREWEASGVRRAQETQTVSREGEAPPRVVDLSTAPAWGAFEHAADLFSDGSIFLVELAGHTRGSMGAWINLDGGPALLAGDAALVIDNYFDRALPVEKMVEDLPEFWRSIHRMRAMQEAIPRLVIFPGHDLSPRTLAPRDDMPLAPFP